MDTKPFVHGQEGTHSVCNTRLEAEGGKARCCECRPHKGCEFDQSPQVDDLTTIEHDITQRVLQGLPQRDLDEFMASLHSRFQTLTTKSQIEVLTPLLTIPSGTLNSERWLREEIDTTITQLKGKL